MAEFVKKNRVNVYNLASLSIHDLFNEIGFGIQLKIMGILCVLMFSTFIWSGLNS